jgi:hypothetical protein
VFFSEEEMLRRRRFIQFMLTPQPPVSGSALRSAKAIRKSKPLSRAKLYRRN